MGTVSKALGLVDILRQSQAPLGLTELARRAGFDKATARRLLLELAASGYVEQDAADRAYALGPALQMLGRVRESRFPLHRAVLPVIRQLAEQTGETVHAAEYCAGELASICIEESSKANRVILDIGQKLPLHATASGFAFLAASPDALLDRVCASPLQHFSGNTPSDAAALRGHVARARTRGFSLADQTLEDGVSSVACAIVNSAGKPVGTLAIALPTSRMGPDAAEEFGALAKRGAEEISARLNGRNIHTTLRKAS